uniref:Reverse transcriptase domain-containing protein n=1 Tax=Tanacetum cinerariifolium TaxID=118510 RepID=A0A6L2JR48_TANCI|nr:hypothetical protein [Tanacetum cinerariifolium]
MSSSTFTYTSISNDYEEPSDTDPLGVVVYGYDRLPMHPVDHHVEVALQAPEQAPPFIVYVSGPEHPPSPNYVPGPKEPKQAPLFPDFVREPEYPEYLVPSDAEAPIEDQPLLNDASPTALSPGYVADSDSEEDLEEDPAYYLTDVGDDNDDESSDDDDDDDDDDEEHEASEDDDEKEEHLALADSFAILAVNLVPSVEETESFETDESVATPPPPPANCTTSRMYVRSQAPIPCPSEVEVYRLRALPTPPPSPLSPLSSPLPQIPSPPLPPTTSPTYAEAPLGYRTAMIWLRVVSPPAHHPLEILSPPLFEFGKSSSAAAARQVRHTLAHTVDYGFIDTMDASIRAVESRAMTAVRVVNDRVTDLATTQRQDAQELYMHCEDAQDERALLGAQVSILRRERRYFSFMASSYEREAIIARQAPIQCPSESEVSRLLALPTPPPSPLSLLSSLLPQIPPPPIPPTTSPTYAEASWGYRAAMIWLRVVSPPAHHPLEILLPPIFEIGKSSSVAAARQVRHMLAHTVDYGFIDTMDASICAPESRAMTAVGVVNDRVTDLATTQRQDAQKLYMRCCMDLLSLFSYLKMPPKKRTATTTTTTTPIKDAQLKAVIAQGVVDALAERDADKSRNGDDSHDSGNDGRRMFLEESDGIEKHVGGLPDMIHGSVMASKPKAIRAVCSKCTNCKRTSHSARDYRSQPAATNNNQRAQGANQRVPTCFECEAQGHFKNNRPKLRNKNQGNQAGNYNAMARAYIVGTARTNLNSNVVTGTFLLNNHYALILFDNGADRSFVSTAFSSLIDIIPTTLDHGYDIDLAHVMGSFDVIIGMDWLSRYHAVIDCAEKIVRIPFGNKTLIVRGDEISNEHESRLNNILCTEMQRYLLKGCPIFLAHVTTKKAEDKSEEKRLKDVPIVQDFPKVFPEDLPGISPTRQVEFQIDLAPGVAPVARAPYRLSPSEMKELSDQL